MECFSLWGNDTLADEETVKMFRPLFSLRVYSVRREFAPPSRVEAFPDGAGFKRKQTGSNRSCLSLKI